MNFQIWKILYNKVSANTSGHALVCITRLTASFTFCFRRGKHSYTAKGKLFAVMFQFKSLLIYLFKFTVYKFKLVYMGHFFPSIFLYNNPGRYG